MTQGDYSELIKAIESLPESLAHLIKLEKQEKWLSLQKAAEYFDCSKALLNDLIANGSLVYKVHYIDLTPNQAKRTYRINVFAVSSKGLKPGVPEK